MCTILISVENNYDEQKIRTSEKFNDSSIMTEE